ncbi:MAG: prolipoprotein diacylglyceryl transferase [Myxococcales bacterium]|nr:prolipoprotein diacylglyceryl transferase [Myxococcales bacterium]
MIPFWYPDKITVVPDVLEFHVFGILVGIAVLLGSWIAQKRAESKGLNPRVVADLGLWLVIIGFIVAHVFSVLAYFPERVFGTPCEDTPNQACLIRGEQFICGADGRCNDGSFMELLYIWSGISSFGGFLGAALGILIFISFKRIIIIPYLFELEGGKGRPVMKYLDAIAYGFAFAWIFGRMGCFSAHDHVGAVTSSPLAVAFPDGWRSGVPAVPGFGPEGITPRYDLGFLEMLWSVGISTFFYFWARTKEGLRPGWFVAMMMMCYAPFRFYLDTLRAIDIDGADKRYFADLVAPGLTPGHLSAIAVFLGGIAVWVYGGKLLKNAEYMAWFDGENAGAPKA